MELERALEVVRENRRGVLVTQRRDGRPQLSNIAYHLGDDGIVRISITDDRAKTKNLRRNPHASLYIGREDFWAYLVVDGDVELTPVAAQPDDATVDELVEYYRAVQGEHPDWDDYRRAMVKDKRLMARLRPTYAYGMWPED
ncbi:MAG: PPOX class F420-dependent oxidoreductase [Actinobacteria bacterium]|nr:PPOX class F420-dependent oxidoreductase [Actinomycetota bacterium]MBV8958751.1 PPOX class F420-dependent oxidoreductase [Actinomycetota bacterium]MBV9665191.1 PPOX class F420-dependent oxidoreductase [Actinomycetota bacterium]